MEIRVHKVETNKITIHPTSDIMPRLTNFILADRSYDLPRIETYSGVAITSGSPYSPESQEVTHLGYIECTIKQGTIDELVEKISNEFDLRILKHSDINWTLTTN